MRENAAHASTGAHAPPMKKDSSGRPRGRASRHLHAPGQVRLIGGRWRGSKLPVADIEGLRPTSDRVRETLFNWLMPVLPGARVLDLFAGSGALGLEALSRGAATATLVERDPLLATALAQVAARLPGGEAATVVQADALAWLPAQPRGSFDIAFLDPPFSAGLWEQALAAVDPLLGASAWLYVESPAGLPVTAPAGWVMHRQGTTREVAHVLYRRLPAPSGEPGAPVDTLGHVPASPGTRPPEPGIE